MKKTQLFENRNILKRVLSWMLLFSIVFSGIPVAQAAPSSFTLSDILEGLNGAQNYGAVARVFTQTGHSEASIFADKLVKAKNDYFMTSKRGLKTSGDAVKLKTDLVVYGPHEAVNNVEFGLFIKDSGTYTKIGDSKTCNIPQIDAGGTWKRAEDILFTIPSDYQTDAFYVFQIDDNAPVMNGAFDKAEFLVQYGDKASGEPIPVLVSDNANFIGSIELAGDHLNAGTSTFKMMQAAGDMYIKGCVVEFGPDIYLYRKTGTGYEKIAPDYASAVDKVYIRDTSETSWTDYLEFEKVKWVPANGSEPGHWTYFDDPIEFVFDVEKSASDILNDCAQLSEDLAEQGGGTYSSTANADGSHSTVYSVEDGKVVSYYTIDTEQNGIVKSETLGNQGSVAISDNEYIVVNVVCPGKDSAVLAANFRPQLKLVTSDGEIMPNAWQADPPKDTSAFSRVIWNFVYDDNGTYKPIEGSFENNAALGGTVLAPKADICLSGVGDASAFIGDTVENGKQYDGYYGSVEIHQMNFSGDIVRHYAITMKPISTEIALTGTKSMAGRNLTSTDVFRFTVRDENGATVTYGENSIVPETINFKPIVYGVSDVGTHTYTITEDEPTDSGIIRDPSTKVVKVVVSMNTTTNELTANVLATESSTLSFVNKVSGYLQVLKTDKADNNKKLSGAEFAIYPDSSCTVGTEVTTLITGSDGTAITGKLPAGDYWLKETMAPDGYTIDDDLPQKITITADHTSTTPLQKTYTDTEKSTCIQLYAKKVLTGREDTTTGFTFELTTTDTGARMPDGDGNKVTVKANETGTFGGITFTYADLGGEESTIFTYVVKEVIPNSPAPGVKYDTNEYTVTVTLEYKNNELTVSTDPDTLTNPVVITNKYSAKGSITFTGEKSIEGRDLKSGDEFSFTVKENGVTVATGKSDETGVITFTTIEYVLNDEKSDIGEHTYVITEDGTSLPGITKDGSEKTVTVVVADNGDGTLSAEIKNGSDSIAFENNYEAESVDVILHAAKIVDGKDDSGAEFTFTLAAVDTGSPTADPAVIKVKAGKSGEFGKLTFDREGTYKYTIQETAGSLPGYTYDTAPRTITIVVADNKEGQLVATVTGGNDFDADTNTQTITNTYEAGYLQVLKTDKADNNKKLSGAEFGVYSTSDCTAGKEVTTLVTGTDGTATSGKLPAGTYWIKEIKAPAGYNIDDVDGQEISITAGHTITTPLQKTYTDTEKSTCIQLYAQKNLVGLDDKATDFSFELTTTDSRAKMPDGIGNKVTVKAGDTGAFGGITFTYADLGGEESTTFTYVVKEIIPETKLPGVKYDTTEHTVTVTLEYKNNELTVSANPGTSTSPVIITNTLEEGYLQVLKTDKADNNKKLSGAEFGVYSTSACTAGKEVTTLVTGTDGTATSGKLPAGTYWIKEIKAPAGYNIDDVDGQEISITADHTITTPLQKTYTDTEKSTCIQLYAQKNLVGLNDTTTGFTFELTTTDTRAKMPDGIGNKVTVKAGDTGAFGGITFTYADLGGEESTTFIYVVKEIIPETKLPGVKYDTTEHTVTVTLEYKNDELTVSTIPGTLTSPVIITNIYASGAIDLTKVDAVTGAELSGAVFTVYKEQACTTKVADMPATDSNGYSKLEDLEPGTYYIKETRAPEGYELNKEGFIVKVEANKTVTVDGGSSKTGINPITNKQKSVGIQVYAQKSLIGHIDDKATFGFELSPVPATNPMPEKGGEVIVVKQDESKSFGGITFTYADLGGEESKTFTYVVKEVIPATKLPGVKYDTNEYTVTVTLEYKNDELIVNTDPGTMTSPVVITNKYAAKGSITFEGDKTLTGRELTAGDEFSFTVTEDGKSVAYGHSDETGVITFTTIEYVLNNEKSDVGEHTYVITEDNTSLKGITKDGSEKTVTVVVTDKGDGTLNAVIENGSDPVKFVNKYEAKGSITFGGEKSIEGRNLKSGDEFSFTVKEGSNVVATGHSDETGVITFTTIEYVLNNEKSDVGEHTYVITEDNTSLKGITKDGSEKTVTVVVTDNGDGTLKTEIMSGSDTIKFINKAEVMGTITFEGGKSMTGRELTTGDEFSFTVTENGKSVAYGHSDETGKITFSEIKYVLNDKTSDLGVHTYSITEDDTNRKGITKDGSELTVKVLVTNNNDGTLKAEIVTGSDTISFVNAYEAKGSITFDGDKTLTGRELTTGDEFSFTVKEGSYVVATGHSDETGVITFTTIEYIQNNEKSDVGEHTYVITEDNTSLKGVTKDGTEKTVKVMVTDNCDGTLKAEIVTGSDSVSFVNKYEAMGTITFGGEKSIDNRPLMPGDEFSFTVTENGETVATGKSDANGKITFTEIKYVVNDKTSNLGEHTYTITENTSTVKDVNASGKSYTVKVNVTDNGDGTLKVESSDPYLKLNFMNELVMTEVSVSKTWIGGEIKDVSKSLHLYTVKNGELDEEITDPQFTYINIKGEVYISKKVPKYDPITKEEIVYAVTESKPEGYEVSYGSSGKHFAQNNGTIINSSYPKFQMNKSAMEDPSQGLQDCTYGLYNDPECTVLKMDLKTDANGNNVVDSLEYGVYYLKEKIAPTGYAVCDETYAVVYTAHADGTEIFGIYEDSTCTTLLSTSPASTIETDENGTGQVELDVGSAKDVTVYVVRESDKAAVAAGTKTANKVTLPSDVLAENNGKLFIHLNKSNVHDYKLIYVDFGAEKSVVGSDPAKADFTFTLKPVDGAPMPENKTQAEITISYPDETRDYFGEIEYGKPGEYTYTVQETTGNVPGYTYDGKEHTLIVTVAADGYGVLIPTATYDGKVVALAKNGTTGQLNNDKYTNTGKIELVNQFSLIAKTQMKASKTLTGRELSGGEFSFTLKAKAGTGTPGYEETVTNGKEGSVIFSEIVYDGASHQGKTYTYELAEVQTAMPGYTLDDTVYEIDVKLSDDMQTVTQTFYKVSGGTRTAVDAVKFVNAYEAKGSITFEGGKTLTGRELTTGDEFSFTVTEDGKTVAYGHSDETGKITFTEIKYVLNDKTSNLGEHTYIVTEDDTELKGITKDGSELTVKVMVTDNGDGTLKTEIVTGSDDVKFVNAYEAKGSVTFEGDKTLTGRELTTGDEFSFTVTEDGKTVAYGHSDETGKITFTEIKYVLNDKTSDLGEHTYIITEDDTSLKGITKDGSELTVKVMVTDNGDGTLKTEVDYGTGMTGAKFVNAYEAKGSVTFEGDKTLTGRELTTGDEFSFTVTEDGKTVAYGHSDETGKITFTEIKYVLNDKTSDLGEHTYIITEDDTSLKGITKDGSELTVKVMVTDNGDGTLKTEVDYGTGMTGAKFVNAYEAKGTITFEGDKTLTGRELTTGDEFSFTVTEDGKTVAYGHSDETGKITFTEIKYVLNDKTSDLGEHTYIITEDDTELKGITKDGSELTVKVMVTDNGDGTLKTEVDYGTGMTGAKFVNAYEAKGSITFDGVKKLEGRELTVGDEFSFTVTEDSKTVAYGHSDETGKITFTTIEYVLNDKTSDLGEHTYIITEDDTSLLGVTKDGRELTVKVMVTDNGDGTLKTEILNTSDKLEFTNTYDASGKITLTGSKALTGRELTVGDEFSFTVKEGSTVVATGKNDTTGKITFSDIIYHLEDEGTHVYTVTEDACTVPGVTGDDAVLTVTVFVTNNKASGTMEAKVINAESNELAFQNAYEASGCVTFTGNKTLTGRELTTGDEFSFTVKEDGKTVATGHSDETGKITFTEIEYVLNDKTSDLGEHTYIVTEDDTDLKGITRDGSELTVKVMVTDNGDGTLKTEIISDGNEITFTNTYKANGTVEIKAVKYIDRIGEIPGADEKFDFYLEKEDGSRITVQNGEKGIVDFGLLEYTEQDVGKTFVYTLSEKQMVNGAYVTDPTVYIMTVDVEDNGDGTLNLIVTLERISADGSRTDMKDDEEITFVNERKISITITKEWEGGEEDEIVLTLYANGQKVPETETVTDPETGKPVDKINYVLDREGYRYTFSLLAPTDADGNPITYGVKEKGVSGYMRIYRNVGEYKNKSDYIYDGGTVINRAVTSIKVKKVWEGIDDESKRPAITLTLYCNGSVYNKQPSGPDKDGWYRWNNLPTVYGGRDAVYYVMEEPVEGFETTYSNTGMHSDVTDRAYNGGTITNSGIPVTGDSMPLVLTGGLLGMSILGVILILRKKKSGRRA